MPDSFPRRIQQHSRTGEAHHQAHLFTHCRLVAMHCAFLARTFLFSERTMVEACVCIAKQLLAIRAKHGVLLLSPAVETNHQLYYSFFSCNTRCFQDSHIFYISSKSKNFFSVRLIIQEEFLIMLLIAGWIYSIVSLLRSFFLRW